MKDKKIIDILLRVTKNVYDKNSDLQKLIDASMVCAGEGVSLVQVFFILVYFAVFFIVMDYPNKRVEDIIFFRVKEKLMEILGVALKRIKFFSGDQEKIM